MPGALPTAAPAGQGTHALASQFLSLLQSSELHLDTAGISELDASSFKLASVEPMPIQFKADSVTAAQQPVSLKGKSPAKPKLQTYVCCEFIPPNLPATDPLETIPLEPLIEVSELTPLIDPEAIIKQQDERFQTTQIEIVVASNKEANDGGIEEALANLDSKVTATPEQGQPVDVGPTTATHSVKPVLAEPKHVAVSKEETEQPVNTLSVSATIAANLAVEFRNAATTFKKGEQPVQIFPTPASVTVNAEAEIKHVAVKPEQSEQSVTTRPITTTEIPATETDAAEMTAAEIQSVATPRQAKQTGKASPTLSASREILAAESGRIKVATEHFRTPVRPSQEPPLISGTDSRQSTELSTAHSHHAENSPTRTLVGEVASLIEQSENSQINVLPVQKPLTPERVRTNRETESALELTTTIRGQQRVDQSLGSDQRFLELNQSSNHGQSPELPVQHARRVEHTVSALIDHPLDKLDTLKSNDSSVRAIENAKKLFESASKSETDQIHVAKQHSEQTRPVPELGGAYVSGATNEPMISSKVTSKHDESTEVKDVRESTFPTANSDEPSVTQSQHFETSTGYRQGKSAASFQVEFSRTSANKPVNQTIGESTFPLEATGGNFEAEQLEQAEDIHGLVPQLIDQIESLLDVGEVAANSILNPDSATQELRIRLHPAELGEVVLLLHRTDEDGTASILVADEAVQQIVEANIDQLEKSLQDLGFSSVEVDVYRDERQDERFRQAEKERGASQSEDAQTTQMEDDQLPRAKRKSDYLVDVMA
jgi:flagellar hook-length control protein FliK